MSNTLTSEVLIIGGGIIGLSLARALHKRGAGRIRIAERSKPGREASFAAAGMLAPQAEADSPDEFFRFCRASNEAYPDFASELLEETGVDIEFDDSGTLYLAFTEHDLVELSRRWEWQNAAGLRVEHLTAQETHKIEPFVSPDSLGSLFFPDDRQVENRQVIEALVRYAELSGIDIVEGCEVTELAFDSGKTVGARTADGRLLAADATVVATGAWTSLIKGADAGKGFPAVRPIRGQMISFGAAKRFFQKVIYSPRGYIVPRKFGRILAGATSEDAGFEDRTTEEGIAEVLTNAVEIAPGLANLNVRDTWSGLRPFSESGRPFIGAAAGVKGLYGAVGHYRNGILLAPLTAELLADVIVDGKVGDLLKSFGNGSMTVGAANQV